MGRVDLNCAHLGEAGGGDCHLPLFKSQDLSTARINNTRQRVLSARLPSWRDYILRTLSQTKMGGSSKAIQAFIYLRQFFQSVESSKRSQQSKTKSKMTQTQTWTRAWVRVKRAMSECCRQPEQVFLHFEMLEQAPSISCMRHIGPFISFWSQHKVHK